MLGMSVNGIGILKVFEIGFVEGIIVSLFMFLIVGVSLVIVLFFLFWIY